MCHIYIALFEADGQLRALERIFEQQSIPCVVYATDSDLMVLGCNKAIWKVHTSRNGRIHKGECFLRHLLVNPPRRTLSDGVNGKLIRTEKEVQERLITFASLTGNNYASFPGVGPATAIDFVTRHGTNLLTISRALASVNTKQGAIIEEIKALCSEVPLHTFWVQMLVVKLSVVPIDKITRAT